MMDGKFLNVLSSAVAEIFSLKTDNYKKRLVSSLSAWFSRAMSVLLMVMLLMMVLGAFSFGFIVMIGDAIGSWSGAAFIVGGVFLVVLLVLFFLRKRLFVRMSVSLFSSFAESREQDRDFRSASLMIVRYLRDSMKSEE